MMRDVCFDDFSDGIWTKHPENPVLASDEDEIHRPSVLRHDGRVFMMYQGAQTPFGIATFDGTLADLVQRLERPPLSRWEPSPFGMVDGGVLKLVDNESDRNPVGVRVEGAGEAYALETRIRCYHGPTHRVSVVMRYADPNTFARFWLHDPGQLFYQECLNGLFSLPQVVGKVPESAENRNKSMARCDVKQLSTKASS